MYQEDSTHNKARSSTIHTALSRCYHPKSIYAEMLLKDSQTEIEEKYMPNKYKFNWDTYKSQSDKVIRLSSSKAKKLLAQWETELEKRNDFLQSIEYSLDTDMEYIKLKESIMKDTIKLWDSYEKCLKSVQEEQNRVQGDQLESLSDTGSFLN
jgi:hypothetical protein